MPESGVGYQVPKGCHYPTPPSGIGLKGVRKPVLGPSRASGRAFLPMHRRRFGIRKFFFSSPVAVLLD